MFIPRNSITQNRLSVLFSANQAKSDGPSNQIGNRKRVIELRKCHVKHLRINHKFCGLDFTIRTCDS